MFVIMVMKRSICCNLHRKPLISLLILGTGKSSMALILSRSTSIPHSLTIHPSNFPKVTPKVHFLGFNLNMNFLILLKNLSRASRWSTLSQDFIIISSTYTLTSLHIISWNKVVAAFNKWLIYSSTQKT